ncbi:MAG: hypothetical protein K2M44_01015 [Clostridia bacterium]|nr:hypothetical protein [Clostridia bacterium]
MDNNKGYPELSGELTLADARILAPLYSGRDGETTAVMQYIYDSYVASDAQIAQTMHTIAIQEMRHHALLGEAIVKCGGNPVIGDYLGWWSGRNLGYNRNIAKMIDDAIRSEEFAIAAYYKACSRLSNESLISLIHAIVRDEEIHIVMLSNLRAKL